MRQLKIIGLITLKDLRLELRRPDILLASFTFSALVVVIFRLTLRTVTLDVAPAVVLVGIVFAASVGFNRSFALERNGNALAGLQTAPIGGELIILGKTLANFILINIVTVLILALAIVLLEVNYWNPIIFAVHLLVNLGISLIGMLFAAAAIRLRARDLLLALLLIPAVSPLLFAAISAVQIVLSSSRSLNELWGWLAIVVAFDIAALALTVFLGDAVLDE